MRIYSQDMGMKYDIEKCTILIIKKWQRQMTEGIELPNEENISTLGEKKTYKLLGIFKADTNKHAERKEKNEEKKRIHQENEKTN